MILIIVGLVSIIGIVIVLWYFSTYNRLINSDNQVGNAFSGIDVQLTKRYDLIPNLVSVVKGYMIHEKETLTKVTELRSRAMSGKASDNEKIALNNQISGALADIKVAVENYPNLKANENFLHLQASLNEIEAQLAAARRTFNAMVTSYNNDVQMFPSSIVASNMGLTAKEWFETTEVKKGNIDVGSLLDK